MLSSINHNEQRGYVELAQKRTHWKPGIPRKEVETTRLTGILPLTDFVSSFSEFESLPGHHSRALEGKTHQAI
jgi:hypothetical protein